jgi:hypothetical protein
MPSGIFDFLSVRNYNEITLKVFNHDAYTHRKSGNYSERSAEGVALCRGVGPAHPVDATADSHITLLSNPPRAAQFEYFKSYSFR